MLYFLHMQDKIKAEIKDAMIAKEMDRLQVLRLISAAFTNELVSQGRPPTDPLSDEDCMKVIKRMAKQRKDSIEQFSAGGREDLADSEKAELVILETLLPAQMSEAEIESRVREKLDANPIDASKKGMFIGQMMKELGETADGGMVKAVIDRLVA
jgi:uncharacterized protein YqeY